VDDQTEETTEQVEETAVEVESDNVESIEETEPKEKKGRKPWEAFKNFAIVFSFVVNFVLIIVLLLVAPIIIPIVSDVAVPIVGGLNESFIGMGAASITRTIEVSDTMPISFTLPLRESTIVTLTNEVQLGNIPTSFVLPGGGGAIYGSVTLALPAGLALPVELSVDVPVSQTIPVNLDVYVDIPLKETQLDAPFTQLQELFGPIDVLLRDLPSSNEDLTERVKSSITNPSPEEDVDTVEETPPTE